jgi:hypothetical protein
MVRLGTEDTDGTPALKLRVTRKDGDVQYVYLDPDSYLEIRITTVRKVRGAEQITETDLGGYQQVVGVWFPFAIESGGKGGPRGSRITIERAEVNVTLDDAWFKLPAAKAQVAAVIAAGPTDPRAITAAVRSTPRWRRRPTETDRSRSSRSCPGSRGSRSSSTATTSSSATRSTCTSSRRSSRQ